MPDISYGLILFDSEKDCVFLSDHPIDQLLLFEPNLAQILKKNQNLLDDSQIKSIVDITLWSFNIEIDFGYLVFSGFEQIISEKSDDLIDTFVIHVKTYANKGTTLGILIAELLPMILLQRHSELTTAFFLTLDMLYDIGIYILNRPFQSFKKIMMSGDLHGSLAMLTLFRESFSKQLNFHQSKNLTQYLPKICESLQPEKRAFQLKQFSRLAQINVQWIYACEEGLNKGLQHLNAHAFETFIQKGIEKYSSQPEKGMVYFSINSEIAKNVFDSLQTSFSLKSIHHKLAQYVHARIGTYVRILSLSQIPKPFQSTNSPLVYSDGMCIYLPDEIDIFPNKDDNQKLYKLLVRWEISLFEYGSYELDLEKLNDLYPEINFQLKHQKGSDFYRYINSFSNTCLAKNLFIVFEHIRVRCCLKRDYYGLLRTGMPIFKSVLQKGNMNHSVLQSIYNAGVFDIHSDRCADKLYDQVMGTIKQLDHQRASVETSAYLVWSFFDAFNVAFNHLEIKTPFNNKLCLEHIEQTIESFDQKALKISSALRQKNIKIYKSDIRKHLYHKKELGHQDIQHLSACATDAHSVKQIMINLKEQNKHHETLAATHEAGELFYYNEWDSDIFSYKIKYTRVIQLEYPQTSNVRYDQSIQEHSGLLRHIRRRFEMIRPEGLKILRRWQEGDAFDYRQLLEYSIDRKIRKTPSDRIYTKRVKEYRDVAVFLLVDLSRSTANVLPQSRKTVLDVEQDAIVIFCEALKQCGDPFAIAGFSSVGRHAVSFYWIKQMDEKMSVFVKNKIGNMTSLRSTRMGAAIRHVNNLFEQFQSKIRLVIVVSDGFPNDADYKKDYAIKDTRKAILEARSKGIYIHGITVNLSVHAHLDDLYGKGNHHVISDITDLPDRLPIIYYQLTKMF